MSFTIYHLISIIILFLCFILVCAIIFLKVKQREIALALYTTNAVLSAIIIYSTLLTINQFTIQAKIGNITYTRDLRHESLIVSSKITNLTKFEINKCYLKLNIMNKPQKASSEIFEKKNMENHIKQNNSVSYTIEIANKLPGNTYKDFSVSVPFPAHFINVEFYYTLKCI